MGAGSQKRTLDSVHIKLPYMNWKLWWYKNTAGKKPYTKKGIFSWRDCWGQWWVPNPFLCKDQVTQGSRSLHPCMQVTGWREAPIPVLPKQLATVHYFYLHIHCQNIGALMVQKQYNGVSLVQEKGSPDGAPPQFDALELSLPST